MSDERVQVGLGKARAKEKDAARNRHSRLFTYAAVDELGGVE